MNENKYRYGELVAFEHQGKTLIGEVEVIDWRGNEKEVYDGCLWSYDIMCGYGRHGNPYLYKHIPESGIKRTFCAVSNHYPLEGNNCWFCGYDLIAETEKMAPEFESCRLHKPHGLPLISLETMVYRYEICSEDSQYIYRVEVSKDKFKGRKVTWIDEWPIGIAPNES